MAIPGQGPEDAAGNVNKQKMLLGQKHSIQMRRLFKKWDEKTLTLDELEYRLGVWLLDDEKRRIFLSLVDRARNSKIDLLYGPAAKRFRLLVRVHLFTDASARLRELHESLTMFAFLVGDEDFGESRTKRKSFAEVGDADE